jgi:predicted 3-demethylubiquinone-9 3-methyltransferase (glyoxalase superfamily)
MQKITPYLWFDDQAEDAARLYTSLFDNASVGKVMRYGKEGFEVHGQPEGKALTTEFSLDGYKLVGLNGGPHFKFSPATSLVALVESEAAADALWQELSTGGDVLMPFQAYDWSPKYGWLIDRYGLSWQIMVGRKEDVGQTVTPSLLFVGGQHGKAEDAINHYVSVFEQSPGRSKIDGIHRYDGTGADPAGTVMHGQFRLNGETFMAMDSAEDHQFGFTEAFSFSVSCDTQDEVNYYWNALSAVPEAERCGWLKDRFGVSWQIIPKIMLELLSDPDQAKSGNVMSAMLQMTKIDIEGLKQAHASAG